MAFTFGYTPQTPEGINRRRQIAQALMMQGMDTSPIQHWSQGAARIAQALVGGYQGQQAEQAALKLQQEQERKAQAEKAAAAAKAAQEAQQPVYKFEGGQWWNVNPNLANPVAVSQAIQKQDEMTAYQKAQIERQRRLDDWKMKTTDAKSQAEPVFKEYQTKDANLASRMEAAENNIGRATDVKANPDATDPTAYSNKFWADDSYWNSAGWRQFDQAKKEWMAALLRKDTGAAVTPSEFEIYDKAYFPQPGDDPQTVKNKEASRRQVAADLATGSGGAYDYFKKKRGERSGAPQLDGPALDNRYQSMSDEDILRELGQ